MGSAGKTFPLPGGRWMAEGQMDEGASVDPTDCFSIQRPSSGPPGHLPPCGGKVLRSAKGRPCAGQTVPKTVLSFRSSP